MINREKRLHWIRVIAIIALLLSLYLTYMYVQQPAVSYCDFGSLFNCSSFLKSPYARLDGVFQFLAVDKGFHIPLYNLPLPTSVLTFLLFLFIFLASIHIQEKKATFGMRPQTASFVIKIFLYIAALYSVYLMYVQSYILYSYCLFCILVTLCIFISLWLFIGLHISLHREVLPKGKKKRKG